MTTDTRAIDYWTNIFTPEGLRHMYLENEELSKLVTWWSMDDRLKGYSPEEFVAIAVKLANDPERVADIRVNQRERLKASPLGQTEAFAKDFYDLMARTVQSRLKIGQPA